MSTLIKTAEGWKRSAGTTDELVMGASTIRKGTIVCNAVNVNDGRLAGSVTFSSPMPDTDYTITLEVVNYNSDGFMNTYPTVINKTANGFSLSFYRHATSTTNSMTMRYTAFKLFTVQGYAELEEKVNSSTVKTITPTILAPNSLEDTWVTVRDGVAYLYVWLTTTAEVPPNGVLATGLPKPLGRNPCCVVIGHGNITHRLGINQAGELIVWDEAMPAAGWGGSCTYLTSK